MSAVSQTPLHEYGWKAHWNVKDYDSRVTSLVRLAPEGSWREFRMVAGPCLEDITGWDKIALIGDASHPLSGITL